MSVADLVVEHVAWLRRKARQYYRDEDDADDLASETICKCLCNASRYKRGMDFRPWAHTIMLNTYITQYNRRHCVLFCGLDGRVPAVGDDFADQAVSVKRILAVVRDCRHKSVNIDCVMLYAKGYTHAEIARRMGIPVGTVKSRICIGRRMLRKALECR